MMAGPRLCAKCAHIHGGGKFGLCFERLADGDICPCLTADIVVIPFDRAKRKRGRPRTNARYPRGEPSKRELCRRAAKAYAELTPEQRAVYVRAARRIDETDLTPGEFALEIGLDARVLWRVRQELFGDAKRMWWAVA